MLLPLATCPCGRVFRAQLVKGSAPLTTAAILSQPSAVAKSPKEQSEQLQNRLQELATQRSGAYPLNYDYSVSTQANYSAAPGQSDSHVGPYAKIRASLDSTYHGIYMPARQRLQDRLIARTLATGSAQKKPWLIFTAGPMGAGKSHVVQWMYERGTFLVDKLVHCDPDLLRSALPEWAGYVARDPLTAGTLTHREAGLLVEIATEAALRAGAHVWVDGSLKDSVWYRGAISDVRRRYPHYSIAILEVHARPERIFERVARRAADTGRDVPREEVLDAIERVPKSVAALCDLCDFSAMIDNSDATPRLTKYCDADCCYVTKSSGEDLTKGWDEIRNRFGLVQHGVTIGVTTVKTSKL